MLKASYIRSEDNHLADAESRLLPDDTEWELSFRAFELIKKELGAPEIDLFASHANAKCPIYISWKRDINSCAIDAFTVPWTNFFFYAFPPFSLILRCLQKIQNDNARGIMVVPLWPAQAWFPLFQRMMTTDYIILGPSAKLILSFSREAHALATNLSLVAAVLCGKRSNLEN